MKYLKITSVFLSVVISMSLVMTPVVVMADDADAPEQTTQATEASEPAETEPAEETVKETKKTVENKAKTNKTVRSPKKNAASGQLHTITVKPVSHGKIKLSKYEGYKGDKITITATPDPGYYYSGYRDANTSATYLGNYFHMFDQDMVLEFIFKETVSHDKGYQLDVFPLRFVITNNATNGTGTVKCIGYVHITSNDESSLYAFFGKLSIPAAVSFEGFSYKVTAIDSNAFKDNKYIQTVTIGSNVTSIGNNAFDGCSNLSKVSGGAKLKTIGSKAFARCPKISSFKISSKVLSKIGSYAFNKDSKLKTIYIKSTTKLKKKGVKKSLKGSKVKTVKVKKSKVKKYRKFFMKKNCGRKVKVKK